MLDNLISLRDDMNTLFASVTIFNFVFNPRKCFRIENLCTMHICLCLNTKRKIICYSKNSVVSVDVVAHPSNMLVFLRSKKITCIKNGLKIKLMILINYIPDIQDENSRNAQKKQKN